MTHEHNHSPSEEVFEQEPRRIGQLFRSVYLPGIRYIGIAVIIFAIFTFGFQIARLILFASAVSNLTPAIAAWVILDIAFLVIIFSSSFLTEQPPRWLNFVLLVLIVLVLLADFAANFGSGEQILLTAALATSAILILAAAVWPTRLNILAVTIYALTLAVGTAVIAGYDEAALMRGFISWYIAIIPCLAVVFFLHLYRRAIRSELRFIHAKGSIDSPRFVPSRNDGEVIRKLDDRAEQLLTDIATGAEALPLSPSKTAEAAELASSLRAQLIKDHDLTWLDHAIADNPLIAQQLTLSDPYKYAGMLDLEKRERLFSALWLLTANTPDDPLQTELSLLPMVESSASPKDGELVQITLRIRGVQAWQIEPTLWSELQELGKIRREQRKNLTEVFIVSRLNPNTAVSAAAEK